VVVGYVRVSMDDQHLSVEAQRRELERIATKASATIRSVHGGSDDSTLRWC
jgi:DNA invertase Pin-like site-specific DNA recombinase